VKDNIDTVGFPTTAGTAFLKKYFPKRSASVVEELLRQGVIIFAKANMHELAAGTTSTNPTFGPVRNPYNPALIPGGSSGGCAAAIAARIAPAALGTDTGGSVRIPAAFCGVVGFRPSTYPRQLYSQKGVVPLVLDLDTIGPMGRSVGDIALLHGAITGRLIDQRESLRSARIGIPTSAYWDDLDSEVERVARSALARLRDAGVTFIEIDLRKVKADAMHILDTLTDGGLIADVQAYLRTLQPPVSLQEMTRHIASRDIREVFVEEVAQALPSKKAILDAQSAGRDAVQTAYRAVFDANALDAVVYPTEVLQPPAIRIDGDVMGQVTEFKGRDVPENDVIARNTLAGAGLGVPALTLPAGLTGGGLPVGLEFGGLPGRDSELLGLCKEAEEAIGRIPRPSNELQHAHALPLRFRSKVSV
jgi:mandelamide amidase